MSTWTVVPCDVCNKQTVIEHPDIMVVCEGCLDRWDAEDEEAGVPPQAEDDDGWFEPSDDEY